jgi:hypothetical protein
MSCSILGIVGLISEVKPLLILLTNSDNQATKQFQSLAPFQTFSKSVLSHG